MPNCANRWAALLFSHRGRIGRLAFLELELVRAVGLTGCWALYRSGHLVLAAGLTPAAAWPGIVGTIKRFRDLGHDPILILPVLMYLSAGLAQAWAKGSVALGAVTLAVYLAYILATPGVSSSSHDAP
jgi:hypothetical protein